MRQDWQRDQWVEEKIKEAGKDAEFNRTFVTFLMKQAYEEGRNRQERYRENEKYADHDL